jgi:hypothetical protein
MPPSSERFDGRTSLAPISTAPDCSLRRAARSSGRGTLRKITDGGRYLGKVQLPSEARMIDTPMRSSCLIERSTTDRPATCMPAPTTSAAVARRSATRLRGGKLADFTDVSFVGVFSVTVDCSSRAAVCPRNSRKCTNYTAVKTEEPILPAGAACCSADPTTR